jgi:hypothetical protein
MVCTTANIAVAIGAVLFAARGCLAAGCNDGVLFVPHTNPHFHVPSLQSFLEIMLQTVETERLLESVDSAVNPTFNSNGGIKSNQNDWDCVQTTNAGLFYWPDGDVNTEDPFYYNHDRAAMLAHAAGGVNGCGSQHLVIHPDFRIVTWTTKSLFEVPEYVREGIRLWVGATLMFGFSALPCIIFNSLCFCGHFYATSARPQPTSTGPSFALSFCWRGTVGVVPLFLTRVL